MFNNQFPTNGDLLSHEEILRYSRHLLMPEVGLEGQQKLKESSVLVVGTGGLGSPVLMYLAAAGVGRIGIVDYDVVDFTNLQRQIIHGSSTIGERKLVSARDRLHDINPGVQLDLYDEPFTSENAMRISEPYDLIIDCTDNFPTRYLVNDVCVLTHKANVYGSIFRFEGKLSVFWAEKGPCYRCLFPEPPPPGLVPSCAEGGVFGVLPGTIGTLQATEALKILLGIGEPLIGKLLLYDALEMSFTELRLKKNPNCKICSDSPEITELIDYEAFCGVPGHDREEDRLAKEWEIEPLQVHDQMSRGEDVGAARRTHRDADRGSFRTPPRRGLTWTAPYMHNGVLATLDAVVAFYDAGGGDDPLKDPRLRPLNLVPSEKADLIAFLEALSGETFDTDAYVWRADDYGYEVIENWRETTN